MTPTLSVTSSIYAPVDLQSNIDRNVIEAKIRLAAALDVSGIQHNQEMIEQYIKEDFVKILGDSLLISEWIDDHRYKTDFAKIDRKFMDKYRSNVIYVSIVNNLSLILGDVGDFNINRLLLASSDPGDSEVQIEKKKIDAFCSLNLDIRNMIARIAYLLAIQGKDIYFPNVEKYIHESNVDLLAFPTDLDGVYTAIDRANDRYEQAREKEESERIKTLVEVHYNMYLLDTDTPTPTPTKQLYIASEIFPTLHNIPWIKIISNDNDVFRRYIRDFVVFQSSSR